MKHGSLTDEIQKYEALAVLITSVMEGHKKYYDLIMELYFKDDKTPKTVSITLKGETTEVPLVCLIDLPRCPSLDRLQSSRKT